MHTPILDPDLHDPEARRLRADRQAGNLASTLEALRAGAWDHRWFLLSRLDGSEPRAPFDALVARASHDPCAYLLRGAHALAWGWLARGTGWAREVTEEGWRLLKERLALASADLRRAAELDPHDPTPWCWLIRVGLGLSWDRADIEHAFEQARARDPEHYPAHAAMLSALAWKWKGSHEEMFAFARAVASAAPAGSDLAGLVVRAHIERLDAHWIAKEDALARAYPARAHSEVQWAHARGPGSPQHRPRAWSHLVRQALLDWYYAAADPRGARAELVHLQHRMDPLVWGDDAASGTRRARKIHDWAFAEEKRRKRATILPIVLGFSLLPLSLLAGVAHWVRSEIAARRDDIVWVHNSTDRTLFISLDDRPLGPIGNKSALELDVAPGVHHVRVADESGALVHDGTFTMPERSVFGWLGHRALYDAGGRGRYVAVRVTYDGSRPEVRPLGGSSRFVLFPSEPHTFYVYFPGERRRGTTLHGVCARADDGSVPCLQ